MERTDGGAIAARTPDLTAGTRTVIIDVAGLGGEEPFADVEPAIREGLRRAAERVEREGPLAPNSAPLVIDSAASGWTLHLALDSGPEQRIMAARHEGANTIKDRAFLEAFCAEIVDLPLQEAADHGSIRLLNRLRDGTHRRHVGGIVMPRNVDAAFVRLEGLIRAALTRARESVGGEPGINFFEVPPTAAWLACGEAERQDAIRRVIEILVEQHSLAAGSVTLAKLETDRLGHPVRVFIAFADGLDPAVKPQLARALEERLKRLVEWRLELYNEERKDSNVIRRL